MFGVVPDRVAALPALLSLRGGGFGAAGIAERAITSYTQALATAPLATNAASAACLAVFSDSVAQNLAAEARASPFDLERSAWMAVWGALVSGVTIFYWLRWLGVLFPQAKTSAVQLLGKVFVNQIVMSPSLNAGFFAFVIWTRTPPRLAITARKGQALLAKYRVDLLPTCLRSCLFWSVVQTINFSLLPARFGVLFTNAAFVLWTTYLSLISNRAAAQKDRPANGAGP